MTMLEKIEELRKVQDFIPRFYEPGRLVQYASSTSTKELTSTPMTGRKFTL